VNPTLATYRRHLAELLRVARKHHDITRYYLGGYCDNSDCDVRGVLVMAKAILGSIRELRCPSCRCLLLFGAHGFGVHGVASAAQYDAMKEQKARVNVTNQLVDERVIREHGTPFDFRPLSDLKIGVTLDQLHKMFNERGGARMSRPFLPIDRNLILPRLRPTRSNTTADAGSTGLDHLARL